MEGQHDGSYVGTHVYHTSKLKDVEWECEIYMQNHAYIEIGNGTYHIAQAIRTDAGLHQFTASKVDNLSKFTLMVE